MDSITGFFSNLKSKITGTASDAAAPVQTALPEVATDSGTQQSLGLTPEVPGTTMTGGKRHRRHRTKRGGKRKAKKTRKH